MPSSCVKNQLCKKNYIPLCVGLICCFSCANFLFAKQSQGNQENQAGKEGAKSEQVRKDLQLEELLNRLKQVGDDELKVIAEPNQTPEQAEQVEKKRKALALFMTGRDREHARKFKTAYSAYQEAIQLDPKSLYLYRAIIPLAFRLEKVEDAINFAKKAVEIDPNNFELLSQLGIYALRRQDIAGSIKYFEKAVKSKTVDKKSGTYVSIISQLGQLYLAIGQKEKAAQSYLVVYQALTQPDQYSLDFRTQRAIESLKGNKAATFEMLGELFLATDKLKQAQDCFERASQASRRNKAVYSYQLARVLNKQKKYTQALEKLQEYFEAKLSSKGIGPYLLYAELLTATGRQDQLLSEIEKLSKKDPKNAELQRYLAERYLDARQFDKAEAILLEILKGKSTGEVQLGLMKVYRARKDAAKTLDALTEAMMNGANTARLEAELELIGQDKKLANEILETGEKQVDELKDDRKKFTQSYLLAKLAMQQKAFDQAIAFYRRALKIRKEPQIQLTLYNELTQFLNSEKQYEKAIEILKEGIDSPALARFRKAFQQSLVRTLVMNDQPDEAIKIIKAIQETEPDSLQWAYMEGWVYYSSKQWDKAIEVYVPLLERAIDAGDAQVRNIRYDLSRCLAFSGRADKAIELLDQMIQDDPKELLWKFQKGWVYYYSKQWPAAIKQFQEILADSENGIQNEALIRQTKFSLSAAFVQNKQFREGEIILEKIYEQDKEDISVCNDLGYLYADQNKKLAQAEEMIKKALDAEPENNAYLDSMGWVKYRLGKFEEAKKYLEQAVKESESGDAVLWDHLGDCYNKLNQKEKAVDAWKKALQHESESKYPDKELIKKIEAKIKP